MNEFNLAIAVTVVVAMLLLLVAGIAIALLIAKRQRLTHDIKLQQLALSHEQEMREAEANIVEATINNVARELHDNIGQMMTYMNLQLENKIIDKPELQEEFAPLKNSLSAARDQLRTLSRTLSSDYINGQSIVRLIQMEILRLQKVSPIRIHFEYDHTEPKLTKEQTLMAFRIFQEFNSNMLKYAQATDFYITVKGTHGFYLCLQDNGKGFDLKESGDKNGLLNMHKRAQLGKMELHIYSQPGDGTKTELQSLST